MKQALQSTILHCICYLAISEYNEIANEAPVSCFILKPNLYIERAFSDWLEVGNFSPVTVFKKARMHLFELCSSDAMTIYHTSDIFMEYLIKYSLGNCFGRPQVTFLLINVS